MRNWKRILAAFGTAALLISNLGSVTQAVLAEDEIPGWEAVEVVPAVDAAEIVEDSESGASDEIAVTEELAPETPDETLVIEELALEASGETETMEEPEGETSDETAIIEELGTETSGEAAAIEGQEIQAEGDTVPVDETASEAANETDDAETTEDTAAEITESEPEVADHTDETMYEQAVDGITVTAYAVENAFDEEVSLVVQMITRQKSLDSIEEQLTESDAVDEFDDFVALDVHFENEKGVEVEPKEGAVTVSFALEEGFLPEEADTSTLAVQHFDESGKETEVVAVADTDETNEETATIVTNADTDEEDAEAAEHEAAVENAFGNTAAEVSGVTVASAASTETAAENTVDSAAGSTPVVTVEFEVENFSTFTLTWQNSRRDQWFEVTLHYVDEDGNDIGPAQQAGDTLSSDDAEVFFSAYRNKSDTSLTYKGAYYGSADGQEVTSAVYNEDWQGSGYGGPQRVTRTLTFLNGEQTVETLTRNNGGSGGRPGQGGGQGVQKADVYLVYASNIEEKSKIRLGKSVTYNNNGTYDLELSVSGATGTSTAKERLDILLVIDKSGSMAENMDGNDTWNDSDKKISKVASAVESLTNSISGNNAISARYSVVQFSNYNSTNVLVNWTDNANAVNTAVSGIRPNGGTNYQAGIRQGISQLDDSLTRSGAEKVVIFLTDGEPTYYINSDWWGTGDAGNGGSYDATAQSRAEQEVQSLNCDAFYAIGVGNVFDIAPGTSEANYPQSVKNLISLVNHVPSTVSADSKGWYAASDTSALNHAFSDIAAKVTNILSEQVTMVDPVSTNVDVLMRADGETPVKLAVKVTDANGAEVGTATGTTLQLAATSNNSTATLRAVYEDGTVALVFPEGYRLEPGYTYAVVTTIEPSASAYAAYAEDQTYPNTADTGTGAHAGEAGYYSNENNAAKVTYYYNGKRQDDEYFPRPVVHVYTRDISVTKVWEDGNDQDGLRPESITVSLYADAEDTGKDLVLTEDNNWTGSFENLRKYKYGQEIAYTISEDAGLNSAYTSEISGSMTAGYTITNAYTPETITIRGTKTWNDADDQDGKRPESITVRLLANGTEVDSRTVTASSADASGNWTFTFADVAKRSGGQEITYTVSEDTVAGYTTTYDQSTYTVINSYIPETTSVRVTKEWDDSDDQDGKRPQNIMVYLLADGEQAGSQTFSGDNNGDWEYTFTNLAKYKNGSLINYTISEQQVTDYSTPVITGDAANGYVIKNSHTPETTAVSVSKTWDDNDDQDGKRPVSVTVTLYADGVATDQTVTLSETNDWQAAFSNLDMYSNGQAINYTVVETAVEGYTPSVTGSAVNGYTIKNSYTPETTYVTVIKEWSDGNDQDGKRPTRVTVTLYADNVVTNETLTLSAENDWQGTFSGLDKYKDGKAISYSVQETVPAGYTVSYKSAAATNTVYIKNTYTPETTGVRVTKTWSDSSNQDGKRPGSIKVNLLADGSPYQTATVTSADSWSYTFDELPKYKVGEDGEGGHQITYTISEEQVENYETEITGFNIVNRYSPEQTSVTVNKVWNDGDDQDGIRPASVTVTLYADGVEKASCDLTAAGSWQHTFTGLDKYKIVDGEGGHLIAYTVDEEAADVPNGYTKSSVTGTVAGGYTITNVHTPATVTVSGTKTWDDSNDQDGMRPDSITIHLLADGTEVQTKEVTAADNWQYTMGDLPKCKVQDGQGGILITYTVTETIGEDAVDAYGYSADISGCNINNSYTPETTNITVNKVWNDSSDQDGKRPTSIEVALYADGDKAAVAPLTLTAANNWQGQFTDLPKYKIGVDDNGDATGGIEIVYTVRETSTLPEGYTASGDGTVDNSYTIINSYTPETITISGTKTWDDSNNQDGKRPECIAVNLLADGVKVDWQTVTADDNDDWSYAFTNKPVYKIGADGKGGVEIVYTVTEDAVTDYAVTYTATDDGYDIENSYTPEETSITVNKAWADGDNQDGLRPASVVVTLYADGEATDKTLTLSADNNWQGTFSGLNRYRDAGTEIRYTVDEAESDVPEGYTASVSSTAAGCYTITNIHTPETVEVSGTKTWDDDNDKAGVRPESITINLLRNGVRIDSKVVTEADNWGYTFSNLPRYYDAGTAYTYTVTEDVVAYYNSNVDGYNVTNTYNDGKHYVVVDPPVEKVVKGNPSSRETFTFTIKAEKESLLASLFGTTPMPEHRQVTITTKDTGRTEFGQMRFSKEGTFTYLVSEESRDANHWTYDDTVYRITYVVTKDDNGIMHAETDISLGDGTPAGSVIFTNEYKKPSDGNGGGDDGDDDDGHHSHRGGGNSVSTTTVTGSTTPIEEIGDIATDAANPSNPDVDSKVGNTTGDDSHMMLYGIAAVIACGALAIWLRRNRIR